MRDDDCESVREHCTDAELGKQPECARGEDCRAYSEGGRVEEIVGDDGLCATCSLAEMQRVIDCVTLEDEGRDEPYAQLLAELLEDDRTERLVRDILRSRAARRAIRNLPPLVADVVAVIGEVER